MKRTANQEAYLKEIRRIRTNLSKLRKQGYDVSELAKKYTTALPKRVTQKMLSELHEITPKKLRKQVQWIGFQPPKGTKLETPSIEYNLPPQNFEQFRTSIPPLPSTPFLPEPEYIEPQIDILDKPVAIDETETVEETPIEEPLQEEQWYDLDEGVIHYKDENGWDNVAPIYYEEGDTDVAIVNGDTGEIVDRIPMEQFVRPDMTDLYIENLRDLTSHFSPKYQAIYNQIIDDMIATNGAKAVADVFIQVNMGTANYIERISNSKEKYDGMEEMLGEMAEILNMSSEVREALREEIVNSSMSDIEEYMD